MEYQYEKDIGEVIVYSMSHEAFRDFINNPSLEIFDNEENIYGGSVYSLVDIQLYSTMWEVVPPNTFVKGVRRLGIRSGTVDEDAHGVIRIDNLPIHTDFVEFFTNGSIETFILENGISDEIEMCHVIYVPETPIPLTAWVKAGNDYFITINELLNDYSFDLPHYVYRFYTKDQFIIKFGLKNGTLIVNGEDITGTNYVKFENEFVYLSFRVILEKLGCTVEWDGENTRAIFYNENGKYALRLKEYPMLVEISDLTRTEPTPPGGVGNVFCKIINDRIILDVQSMRSVVKLVGAIIDVNYDELTVSVKSQ